MLEDQLTWHWRCLGRLAPLQHFFGGSMCSAFFEPQMQWYYHVYGSENSLQIQGGQAVVKLAHQPTKRSGFPLLQCSSASVYPTRYNIFNVVLNVFTVDFKAFFSGLCRLKRFFKFLLPQNLVWLFGLKTWSLRHLLVLNATIARSKHRYADVHEGFPGLCWLQHLQCFSNMSTTNVDIFFHSITSPKRWFAVSLQSKIRETQLFQGSFCHFSPPAILSCKTRHNFGSTFCQ